MSFCCRVESSDWMQWLDLVAECSGIISGIQDGRLKRVETLKFKEHQAVCKVKHLSS